MQKKILSVLFACLLLGTMTAAATAEDITVLYTNDIHTYIDNAVGVGNETGLTYSRLAALADAEDALLVDAGDHIQGSAYGGMDEGATIIRLMNAAGYDCATPGNHEFDYGMERFLAAAEAADFPYLSCNFTRADGSLLLDSYQILEAGGAKLAFIGITTPETLTSCRPTYFMNEAGEYIYSIAGGPDGTALYHSVQTAIDAARADGADYILALGHLGVDPSSAPWTSRDVIAHTTGLDAFIDGHSHTTLEAETVLDKNGEPVILTQTGSYLNAVGRLTISADGTITTELLTGAELADLTPDPTVQAIEDAWIREIDDRLGEVIGFSEITLDNFDADGTRLVRRQPTNSGDFTADALYWFFDSMGLDVDAAVMNGGGIRNGAVTGELSYLTCKEIHTFGNVACLQTVTGQQLLDALEWSVHLLQPDGSYEDGSFLHVSGLRFTVDLTIPSTVQSDPFGVWTGGPTGAYRVRKVEVLDPETGSYVPLDPAASYNLAGYNYTLRDLGGGYAMFEGAVNVLDFAAEDYMVLADYIRSFPADTKTGLPTITAAHGYADLHGSGRITLLTEPAAAQTYIVRAGDSLWRIAREQLDAGSRWREIFEQNRAVIRDPDRIYIGQILQLPA